MTVKTDNKSLIGVHVFEAAGLGIAPFICVGVRKNMFDCGDSTSKPGGTCKYCGTGIMWECLIRSADGREFVVGSECVKKTGDAGLIRAYKTHPVVRQAQAAARNRKAMAVAAEMNLLISQHAEQLVSMPHPMGFVDRKTGAALTYLDYVQWMVQHAGATGMAYTLKTTKAAIDADEI